MAGTYQQGVDRATPGCLVFLLDHSYSMIEPLAGSQRSKVDVMATAINRLLTEVVIRCEKAEVVRHFFDVSVIGYTTDPRGTPIIGPALKGALAGREMVSVVELSDHLLRIEEKVKKVDDGAGGLVDVTTKLAVWYEAPTAWEMAGSPMCAALNYVEKIAAAWCASHPRSFPPLVIHIAGGKSIDGDPEPVARSLRSVRTQDGELLLSICHLSSDWTRGILFPASEDELPDDDRTRRLFRMSSPLPECMCSMAAVHQVPCSAGTRLMAFNTDPIGLFFAWNWRPAPPVEMIRDESEVWDAATESPKEPKQFLV
jgi:hypothetical protein